MKQKSIFITGGAGFIGSAVIRQFIAETDVQVVNIDKLTYAGNLATLDDALDDPRHCFEQVDICDAAAIAALFDKYQPDAIMHLAAASHVDRSIDGPADFIQTNSVGTYILLDVAKKSWDLLDADKKSSFKFHHVSTDEVDGDLEADGFFTDETSYEPSSPYSASKASSDPLVRARHRTHGISILITNCSNNSGGYQYPDKLHTLIKLTAPVC
mgnify:CR=1 FL=1